MSDLEQGYDAGEHNANLHAEVVRLKNLGVHKDCSTFFMMTTRGHLPIPVVAGLLGLHRPRVDRFEWHFTVAPSTSAGYNELVFDMLRSPHRFQYVFSVEDDVIIPGNALLRLIRAMEQGYDMVGALCWERKEDGVPMVLGNPDAPESTFHPQLPQENALMPVNGLHLGCSLIKADIFRDKRWGQPTTPLPWFEEGKRLGHPEDEPETARITPDIWFCDLIGKMGYRMAVDTSIKVGHFDRATGRIF